MKRSPAAVVGLALLTGLAHPAAHQGGFKLSAINGGAGLQPEGGGGFGLAVVALGDLDGNGVLDLAIGEPDRDDGGEDRGAVWVVLRRSDGTAKNSVRLSATSGGFPGVLADKSHFGRALAAPGDLNGDNVPDLYVGAPSEDGVGPGAVWAVYLDSGGSAVGALEITEDSGGLGSGPGSALEGLWTFGSSLAILGDLDGDGVDELAVGSSKSGSIIHRRRVWILFPQVGGAGLVRDWQRLGPSFGIHGQEGGYQGTSLREFGTAVAGPGDLNADGIPDLVVGSPGFDNTGPFFTLDDGRLEVLFLTGTGTIASQAEVLLGEVFPFADSKVLGFGDTLTRLDDPDQDGIFDLGVGRWPVGIFARLRLDASGSAVSSELIGLGESEFDLPVLVDDQFGRAIALLDDGNQDGTPGLAVGVPQDDDGGTARGAVWILDEGPGDGFPNHHLGAVVEERRIGINAPTGGFGGTFDESQGLFGDHRVAVIGDVDGDGIEDLAWGIPYDSTSGFERGAVYVLFLEADGSVRTQARIAHQTGGLQRDLGERSHLGRSLAAAGDRDGNGVPDLLVGAFDRQASPDRGGFLFLALGRDGSVLGERWVADGQSGFGGGADTHSSLGSSLTALGDLDGDGLGEWAVGADQAAGGDGSVFVLFTAPDESIVAWTALALGQDGLPSPEPGAGFGAALTSLADLNGDGLRELAIGAPDYTVDAGGVTYRSGAVLVLFPGSNGVPTGFTLLGASEGLETSGHSGVDFGAALACVSDLDGDGFEELACHGQSSLYLVDLRPFAAVETLSRYLLGINNVRQVEQFDAAVAALGHSSGGTPSLVVVDRKGFFDSVEILRLQGPLARAETYGCLGTPAGSLAVLAGGGVIGGTLTLTIDNPLGTQAGPAAPILIFGSAPLDCGSVSIPGWGMEAPGSPGDVLIQDTDPLFSLVGPIWSGSGPAVMDLPIPHDSSLVGERVVAQAVLWDPLAALGIEFALTEALDLRFGAGPPDPAQ